MQNNQPQIEWWKSACEKNPDPIAFVDLDQRFIFCNNAWSKLTGYSEPELREKKRSNITKSDDIGPDQSEIDNIIKGSKVEYYIEKTIIRKDRTEILVKMFVHRYPEYGIHEGYLIFARRATSEDYEDLKSKFLDLHKTVLILQQNAIGSQLIAQQMEIIEQKLEQNKEIAKMAMNRDSNHINIGDKFGNRSNKAGRDNIQGLSSNAIILITVLIGVFILTVASLGGIIIYLILNKPV